MFNKKEIFDTPPACNRTIYNYVENILDRNKTEQNVSLYVQIL